MPFPEPEEGETVIQPAEEVAVQEASLETVNVAAVVPSAPTRMICPVAGTSREGRNSCLGK